MIQTLYYANCPVTIGKRYTFDAAHRLPLHGGKCSRPHGHTYTLEVDFTGKVQEHPGASQGMVLDYYLISEIINQEIMSRFDHQDLNVVMREYFAADPEVENCTTAERMVAVFVGILAARLRTILSDAGGWDDAGKWDDTVVITRVRLCETPNSWAEWRAS